MCILATTGVYITKWSRIALQHASGISEETRAYITEQQSTHHTADMYLQPVICMHIRNIIFLFIRPLGLRSDVMPSYFVPPLHASHRILPVAHD